MAAPIRPRSDPSNDFDVPASARHAEHAEPAPSTAAPPPPPPADDGRGSTTSSKPDEAKATAKSDGEPLPDDVKGCADELARLNERLRAVKLSSREYHALERRIERLQDHFFKVQNRPAKAAPDTRSHPVWGKVRQDAEYKRLSAEVVRAYKSWKAKYDEFDKAGLLPGSAARRIEEVQFQATQNCHCASSVLECATKVATLKAIGPQMVAQAQHIIGKLFAALADPFRALLDRADAVLTELEKNAAHAEIDFFAKHGLPRVETEVSRRVASARAEVANHRSRLPHFLGDDSMHPSATRTWHPPKELVGDL